VTTKLGQKLTQHQPAAEWVSNEAKITTQHSPRTHANVRQNTLAPKDQGTNLHQENTLVSTKQNRQRVIKVQIKVQINCEKS
jgi:hypothetical protein